MTKKKDKYHKKVSQLNANASMNNSDKDAQGNRPINNDKQGSEVVKDGTSTNDKIKNENKGINKKKNNKKVDKGFLNIKDSIKNANNGISQHFPKTNLVAAIIGATVLSKFFTAIDTKLIKKKVPIIYRNRLTKVEQDAVTKLPIVPRKAAIEPITRPQLDLTRMVTVCVEEMDLNDQDRQEIDRIERANHERLQQQLRDEHEASERSRRAAHQASEETALNDYWMRYGRLKMEYEERNSRTRNAPPFEEPERPVLVAFQPAQPFRPTEYVPIEPRSNRGVSLSKNADGTWSKLAKLNVVEEVVSLGVALQGVANKIFTSTEVDSIKSQHEKDLAAYDKMMKNQETDDANFLNTFWEGISIRSRQAMADKLPGGLVELEKMFTSKQVGPLIDLFYLTHDTSGLYQTSSPQDKNAFIQAEKNYLSDDKIKQRKGESVVDYVARMKSKFELSMLLREICGDDWKHDELEWIKKLVSLSISSSLSEYKNALFNRTPLLGTLNINYQPTFVAQCEELIKMSKEMLPGRSDDTKKSSSKRSGRKKDSAPAVDKVAMSTKVSIEPAASGDPVRHYIDATNISSKVLEAIVRKRRHDIEKIISADNKGDPDPSKTPSKRPRGKQGPKSTSKKKVNNYAHNKTKQPRTGGKGKHVHHTNLDSPGSSSQSGSSNDSSDDTSDDDDYDDVDEYTSHFTLSSISQLQCCQSIASGGCKGQCCMKTVPTKRFIFSSPPKDIVSANQPGTLAIDTASTINLLSKEHVGREAIMPLNRPIQLKGVQGMQSHITHYFIHQLFGLCLLGEGTSILSYGMLMAMGYQVTKADKDVISLKHPQLKGRAPIAFRGTADKLYVAHDPTLVKGWVPLTGKDRIGQFRTIINQGVEFHEYKISFDEGDTYVDKGIHAVLVEASRAEDILATIQSDLAQPVLSTNVEGRLGGDEGCSSKSN